MFDAHKEAKHHKPNTKELKASARPWRRSLDLGWTIPVNTAAVRFSLKRDVEAMIAPWDRHGHLHA